MTLPGETDDRFDRVSPGYSAIRSIIRALPGMRQFASRVRGLSSWNWETMMTSDRQYSKAGMGAAVLICLLALLTACRSGLSAGAGLRENSGRTRVSNTGSTSPVVITNPVLGFWVGTWKLQQAERILRTYPHAQSPVPDSLELRIMPYDLDWDDLLTHSGTPLAGEFVYKAPDGTIQQWGTLEPILYPSGGITLYPWEIVLGPPWEASRFPYVLTRDGDQFSLELASCSLNVRMRMKKISDDPPRPSPVWQHWNCRMDDSPFLKSESDYREWRWRTRDSQPLR